MAFFMEHTMAYFDGAFVNKQGTGLEKYKQVMEHKFLVELHGSSQYAELWISKVFSKWFECKILDSSTNLKIWSKKKVRIAPWMEEGAWNLLAQIASCGVFWIPSTTNVLPLSSGDN